MEQGGINVRYLNSIIIVALMSVLFISPALARNANLRGVQENWNRQADNIRQQRHDRQAQRQDRWNDRREYRRDQWNNMRDGSRNFGGGGNFNRGDGHRGGGHRGGRHR